MNRCDTCRYQHDVEFDACHICNNEQDMYRKKLTNADMLRAMRDEELAKFMGELPCCPPGADLAEMCYPNDSCEGTELQIKCWLNWLKQKAGE